ncbi:hypothetical protein EVAR_37797_1 [Eumeta japonica]|uniref:Uncharacterized protein n=1 Tax=Eumeta variegata TaxID=151549 RepID=A0A4C1W797_EUMVA|nr:hypothetical protein EVAR_37797_1 [Eumeta japonica]
MSDFTPAVLCDRERALVWASQPEWREYIGIDSGADIRETKDETGIENESGTRTTPKTPEAVARRLRRSTTGRYPPRGLHAGRYVTPRRDRR